MNRADQNINPMDIRATGCVKCAQADEWKRLRLKILGLKNTHFHSFQMDAAPIAASRTMPSTFVRIRAMNVAWRKGPDGNRKFDFKGLEDTFGASFESASGLAFLRMALPATGCRSVASGEGRTGRGSVGKCVPTGTIGTKSNERSIFDPPSSILIPFPPAYDFTDGSTRRFVIGRPPDRVETTMDSQSQFRFNHRPAAVGTWNRTQSRWSRPHLRIRPVALGPLTFSRLPLILFLLALFVLQSAASRAAEPSRVESPAERGYRWLTTKPYLPADFDQEVFDNLWKVWPAELREKARDASADERRRMTLSRYGLAERPAGDAAPTALGYVPDGQSGWVMNCLACHTGKVAGEVILGAPNSLFALETLTEEVRQTKLRMLKPLTHMDLGSLKMPLGTTRGTTNAVMFGVALGALRDQDLNFRDELSVPKMLHHDVDAPPFWNVRRKKYLYSDGFVAKSHRPLLQFVMVPGNSGATLRAWEQEYVDILAWIESLEAPKYPGSIDRPLAAQGKVAFERVCARCHGTYGDQEFYPNRIVAIEDVGTDPVRLQSLTVEYRQAMQDGWFGEYGAKPYFTNPGGYVAPPLNGIWASAPYLHNGSVPTLWHLLRPAERPVIWRRTETGYDHLRMGLEISAFEALPPTVKSAAEKREYFDTRKPGKSGAGHPFPNELSDEDKQAVLEYLKTL